MRKYQRTKTDVQQKKISRANWQIFKNKYKIYKLLREKNKQEYTIPVMEMNRDITTMNTKNIITDITYNFTLIAQNF